MMYGELYQYFIRHKQLNVPGIGIFMLERKPAVSDFPNRIINAPAFSIVFQQSTATPSTNFFKWLAQAFAIPEREAVIRFNDFVFDLKQRLTNGDKVSWEGVGVLSAGLGGGIRFEPALKDTAIDPPVKAEKVIREKAEHTVRVGEDEKTAAQMIELLKQPGARKSHWWAWVLVIALLATMFLGWYFSAYGLRTSSTGNSQKLNPGEPAPTYKSQ